MKRKILRYSIFPSPFQANELTEISVPSQSFKHSVTDVSQYHPESELRKAINSQALGSVASAFYDYPASRRQDIDINNVEVPITRQKGLDRAVLSDMVHELGTQLVNDVKSSQVSNPVSQPATPSTDSSAPASQPIS